MQKSVTLHLSSLATSLKKNALTRAANCFSHNKGTLIHKPDEIFESVLQILNWFVTRFVYR